METLAFIGMTVFSIRFILWSIIFGYGLYKYYKNFALEKVSLLHFVIASIVFFFSGVISVMVFFDIGLILFLPFLPFGSSLVGQLFMEQTIWFCSAILISIVLLIVAYYCIIKKLSNVKLLTTYWIGLFIFGGWYFLKLMPSILF